MAFQYRFGLSATSMSSALQPPLTVLIRRLSFDRNNFRLSTRRILRPGHPRPGLVVILYEFLGEFRQTFLDGRSLSKDANATWLGYSVGKWQGDVLVVYSTGFNGKTWLDVAGHPSTDALNITERFRRRDFGHLDLQITIDDPKAYT
jgi:hypothetical protein